MPVLSSVIRSFKVFKQLYIFPWIFSLDFCVNVKEFWLLFVTREKAEYFYVNEFFKVVQGTLF